MAVSGYLDENHEAVARILEAYDELVDRAEHFREVLRPQLPEAEASGDSRWVGRVQRCMGSLEALIETLDNAALDSLMELRHYQHHIRVAKQGKMV